VLGAISYLVAHRDRVVSVAELLRELGSGGASARPSAVHWTLHRARQALEQTSRTGPIRTVRGRGYRFVETVQLDAAEWTNVGPMTPPTPTANEDTALRFLRACGAGGIAHPGGTLLEHLLRTARRLEGWGASPALVAAGLLHAAYGTHGFPTALLPLERREELAVLIGPEAEAIVYAYGSADRTCGAAASPDAIDLRDRFTGALYTPSAPLSRAFAELTCANELDVLAHADGLDEESTRSLFDLLLACRPQASPAAREAVDAALHSRGRSATGSRPRPDEVLAYRQAGTRGPTVVLVHGGAGPELTWSRQEVLSTQFRLVIPWRRGFGPSAPSERQDWELDARDLLRWMPAGAHVVAHSYGGLAATVAAARAPGRFASLTLIEPPLWAVAELDPEVQRLARLARAFSSGDDEGARARFLELAAMPETHPDTARASRLARALREPGEARPDFAALRAAGLAVLVVSGAHDAGIERVCDALASAANGERVVIPGAGHAVQRRPSFNDRLVSFVTSAASRATAPAPV
jgi:pimeloyl-ACP methyl ester carboxylesterase/DNA-binding winged helix-turn-helix (wHTH) protein